MEDRSRDGGGSLTGNHAGWHESLHWLNSLSGNVPFLSHSLPMTGQHADWK